MVDLVFQISNIVTTNPSSDRNLIHSTYYGGARLDNFTDIETDGDGNIFITGSTYSPTFPTVSGQITPSNSNPDAIVLKLNQNYIESAILLPPNLNVFHLNRLNGIYEDQHYTE